MTGGAEQFGGEGYGQIVQVKDYGVEQLYTMLGVTNLASGVVTLQYHMCIFEPRPHMTCTRLRDHVVQIMASQRTLDTWLPAAKEKKTASDRR